MSSSKGRGVSRGVRLSVVDVVKPLGGAKRMRVASGDVVGLNKIRDNRERSERERRAMERELGKDDQALLKDMRKGLPGGEQELENDSTINDNPQGAGADIPNDAATVPDPDKQMRPEELAEAVQAAISDPKYSLRYRFVKDTRSWRNRRARETQNWAPQLPGLTDAYLRWRWPAPSNSPSAPNVNEGHAMEIDDDCPFTIDVINIYDKNVTATIPRRASETTANALVAAGYLGNSPVSPTLALSLRTLEFFMHIRRRKPSFSFEAFAKVMCDEYRIPYKRQWRIALADAFDIFLEIVRRVDSLVDVELGRDGEDWRATNACPPCNYELKDEKPLKFRKMICFDGNTSAKRMDTPGFRTRGDMRVFQSDYFLENDEVNRWELSGVRLPKGPEVPAADDELWEDVEDDDEGEAEEEDSPEEKPGGNVEADSAAKDLSQCVKNWKAAQTDTKKRVLGMFDETGWFACGCRHGIMLWVADMIRSGEQAKYPLAIVNKALNVLGPKLLMGYDIGCSFQGTIESTTLGPRFTESGSRCCVNAYHGYAHSYDCQVGNHPNNIEGMGIEDLETMERFFSASNATAPVIRHASKYRRRMFLDLFLRQHDKDKYASIGLMLRNNYQQALAIIHEQTGLLDDILSSLNITRQDLDEWQVQQTQYFQTVGKEPDHDAHRIAYVELLQELRDAKVAADAKANNFLNAVGDDYNIASGGGVTYESELSRTRKLETQRKSAREKVDRVTREIITMEMRLKIEKRWDPSMQDYMDTLSYMTERTYHKALDRLEKLVVQRLFELHRLNLSGVGYRARSLLAKAMQTRSKAIRNAVKRYNAAARDLTPPRRQLDWNQISKYNFVEEFNLLRDTRRDVRKDKWSDVEVREAMKMHQRIKRANEEIYRINIEARRLYTSIADEHDLFAEVQGRLRDSGKMHLHGAVLEFCTYREQVNQKLLSYLHDITQMDGYTGEMDLRGVRLGTNPSPDKGKSKANMATEDISNSLEDSDDEDDEENARVGGLIDVVAELAIS